MRTTKRSLALLGVVGATFVFWGCDEKTDTSTTRGDSKGDEAGDHGNDQGDAESDSGGTTMSMTTTPMTSGGTGGTGGTGGEIMIPEQCQALCDCIAMLGNDPLSCGMACGGAIADDDPNDHQQCLDYLASTSQTDCNSQCETFGGG
jgi:hypothetical protein